MLSQQEMIQLRQEKMYKEYKDALKLKKELVERFQNGKLTRQDKKHVYVKTKNAYHGENIWGGRCFYVGKECIYLTGEFRGKIDKESIKLAKKFKGYKIKCEVLYAKLGSDFADTIGLRSGGFYSFNPDRLTPDSILSIKLISFTQIC